MAAKKVVIQVRLEADLKQDAEARAASLDKTMTQYVLGLLKDDLYGKRPHKPAKRRERQQELSL